MRLNLHCKSKGKAGVSVKVQLPRIDNSFDTIGTLHFYKRETLELFIDSLKSRFIVTVAGQ